MKFFSMKKYFQRHLHLKVNDLMHCEETLRAMENKQN